MNAPLPRPSGFLYSPMFPLGPDRTVWDKLPIAGVRTATCDGQTVLRVTPDALSELAFEAFRRVSHLLRPGHLAQLRAILDDPDEYARILARSPIGRFGEAWELVGPAVFLASDASGLVTGHSLLVDGGWTAT